MKGLIFDNIGLKVSAVLLSVFLWFFVASRGQSEISFEAPLEFRDIPADLGIVSSSTKSVMLTIRGQERFVKSLNASNIGVFINMSKAREGEGIYHVSKEDIKVPFAISVTGVEPSAIKVKLEERVARSVPVKVSIIGTTRGNATVSTTVDPKNVVISGLKSDVSQIHFIKTEEVDISDIRDTVTENLELDTTGLNIVPAVSKVSVKFTFTEKKR
ncbi:MAG: hypothetical protein FIA94_12480 [Nitrospirae bacterium]|nr:hypothetical protein [Nitrospirota bacterium]